MTEKLLQEENQLSAKDVLFKVKKLDMFIKKAERRIDYHEKKLNRLREQLKTEVKLIKERLTA